MLKSPNVQTASAMTESLCKVADKVGGCRNTQSGRARHSVRAANQTDGLERRARSDAPYLETHANLTRCSSRHAFFSVTAFTLTELLVVIAILAILAATQLPALTRAKVPVNLTRCMNNCRQIAQATFLYRSDNNDTYPTGPRITSMATVDNPAGWPMRLLRYMGGYTPTNQPAVYVCPNEQYTVNAPFQLHFQANRNVFCDVNDCPTGLLGSQVRSTSVYWIIMEKHPAHYADIRSGALITDYLLDWNTSFGLGAGMRRHNGGLIAAAVDGHVEWLRMPQYNPGKPGPLDFLELGDCYTPPNSGAYAPYWVNNGPRAKLFCRDTPGGPL